MIHTQTLPADRVHPSKRRPAMRTPVESRSIHFFLGGFFAVALCAMSVTSLPWHPVGQAQAQPSENLSIAIVQVAKKNIPAVVHIKVTERKEVANPLLPFENEPFFKRFFNMPKMPRKFQKEIQGLGSGVVMDSSGHILTNNHVAGGATKLEVVLSDGSQYPAKLVGADPKSDLAVIQIEAKHTLPQVSFGDSDQLEVGEWVGP